MARPWPEQQPLEQRRRVGPSAAGSDPRALAQDAVNLVPEVLGDDRPMLAGIGNALVHGLADVDPVVQQLVEETLVDQLAAARPDALGSERPSESRRRADLQETLEDQAHGLRFAVVDDRACGPAPR